MATPNYGYEKRQRELAKKQKKEEKLRAKAARKGDETAGEGAQQPQADPSSAADANQGSGGSAA